MALRGVASNANASAATSLSVTVSGIGGTGPQNGDVVFLFGSFGGSGTQTPTFPSGFVAIPNCTNQNNAYTFCGVYKIAGSSEPASYTVSGLVSDLHNLHCRVYSGRSATQFTATALTGVTAITNINSSTLSINGLTAAAGDDICMVLGFSVDWGTSNTLTLTPPSGFGNAITFGNGASVFTALMGAMDRVNAPAGATGTLPVPETFSQSESSNFAAFLISIAAGSQPPVSYAMPSSYVM